MYLSESKRMYHDVSVLRWSLVKTKWFLTPPNLAVCVCSSLTGSNKRVTQGGDLLWKRGTQSDLLKALWRLTNYSDKLTLLA